MPIFYHRNQNLVFLRLIRRYLQYKYQNDQIAEVKFAAIMALQDDMNYMREKKRKIYREMQQIDSGKVDEALMEFYELNQQRLWIGIWNKEKSNK